MSEKTYVAEFGIYENCHITGKEERTIHATSQVEAEAIAKSLANEIETECIAGQRAALVANGYEPEELPVSDWWADLEEVYEE